MLYGADSIVIEFLVLPHYNYFLLLALVASEVPLDWLASLPLGLFDEKQYFRL